jgi:hypothetical protein
VGSVGNEPLASRKVRPIHYGAIAAYLLSRGAVIAIFGLRIALWFMWAVIFAVCALVGVKTLGLAIIRYRIGVIRTDFGLIEENRPPSGDCFCSKCSPPPTYLMKSFLLGPLDSMTDAAEPRKSTESKLTVVRADIARLCRTSPTTDTYRYVCGR